MTEIDLAEPATAAKLKQRHRDWVVLPALCLLTMGLMVVSTEVLSRFFYPVTQTGFQNCFAASDPTGDAAVKPNSVCRERTAESNLEAEYRFNSRGDRAGTELTPKAPGTYRIVLIGSSITQGLFVPREQTFAALLPAELSTATGRKVEVYNKATGGMFRGGPYPTPNSAKNFDQVLAAQPDLILWVITPTDIVNSGAAEASVSTASEESARPETALARPENFLGKIVSSIVNGTFSDRLKVRWENTRTSIVLKHLLIASESQDEYIKSYLGNADNAGFLKTEPDSRWSMHLHIFESELAAISKAANAAGVPLTAVYVPNRPLAAMVSHGDWPAGYNPLKLDCEVRNSIVNHGGRFIDILGGYRSVPDPERDYFPVDGHPDANGHATIALLVARGLTGGTVPELKATTAAAAAPEPCG